MNSQLSQLRPLHLPEPIGFFPPAPGVSLLIVLVIAVLTLFIVWLIKRYRARRAIRAALKELRFLQREYQRQGNAVVTARQLSALVRRVAMVSHSRRDVASLYGEAYFALFEGKPWAKQLSQMVIEEKNVAEIDTFFPVIKAWIKSSKPYSLGERHV